MKTARKLLYFGSFVGLALTLAIVLNRMGRPSIASLLLASVLGASLAGAPGLVHRRAWPLALVLLPLGAYLLLRAQVPIPSDVHGLGGQASLLLEQLRSGAKTYQGDGFPLDFAAATHVGLVVSLAVYSAVGLAAFLVLSLRLAVPGLVIFLAMLGFGLTTDGADKMVWAPLIFLLLGSCLLVFSRSLERGRWKVTDAISGVSVATLAALLALSLLSATSVAAAPPWQDWHSWGAVGTDSVHLSFNWMVNFPRLLDPAINTPVMRVKSPLASYWRANALASFDGATWSSDQSLSGDQPTPESSSGSYTYRLPSIRPEPPGQLVTEYFHVESTYTDHLFSGGSPRSLVITDAVSLQVPDSLALVVDPPIGPRLDYSITAVVPQLTASDLLARGRIYPPDILNEYVGLPFPTRSDLRGPSPEAAWRLAMSDSPGRREWLGLYRLNQEIVGASTDPYRIALKVEEYLRLHYAYSLTPPQTKDLSPYAAFLFRTRIGYCQHFAGAMAVLLRFDGIPARVAVGFTTGNLGKDGMFLVTRNDAHAWVEVYFPGVGWVPFDPTPGKTIPGAGASSANAGFVDPAVGGSVGNARGSAGATADPGALRKIKGADGRSSRSEAPPARGGSAGWLLFSAIVGALLVIWPVGRAVWRSRRPRLGGLEARLIATLALVYRDLEDSGVDVPRSQTIDETAQFLKAYLDLDAAALMDRVQAVLFGGRAATEEDLTDVAALRRELGRRMRARRGRLRALLALYGLSGASTARA
jgi:hypothetical protein